MLLRMPDPDNVQISLTDQPIDDGLSEADMLEQLLIDSIRNLRDAVDGSFNGDMRTFATDLLGSIREVRRCSGGGSAAHK